MINHNFYSQEAEEVVLGTIIMNNDYYRSISDTLHSSHFFFPQNQAIFARIEEGIKNDQIQNQVTLKQFFDSESSIKEIGGSLYLAKLISSASAVVDIRHYANLIVDNHNKREQLFIYQSAITDLETKSAVKVGEEVLEKVSKLENESNVVAVYDGTDMAAGLQEIWKKKPDAIQSKITPLDKMLNGGFYPQKLYVIGAAPGCGKTSFAQQIILSALESGKKCLFFSMEMEKENVLTRFLSAISKINPFRILLNNFFEHETSLFNHACQKWERFKSNILITEKGSLSISQIRSTVKRIKRKHKIDLVAVDYIQIIQTRDQKNLNEATLIKENVTALKEIAKEFNVVMIALSQITKDALGGRPGLKSLKGSGGIAEGADTVINMWTDSDQEQEGQKNKNLNMEIAKNRNGICGTLSVNFDGEFGIFSEQNIKQQF